MSITIEIGNYTGESYALDKQLVGAVVLTGNLKDGTSVVDPVILIHNNVALTGNYAHIPAFNRYYFINDIVSIRTGLWRVACHVDVLMSWKNRIREQRAVIARNQNSYNLYLNDDKFQVTANPRIQQLAFPSGPWNQGESQILVVTGNNVSIV